MAARRTNTEAQTPSHSAGDRRCCTTSCWAMSLQLSLVAALQTAHGRKLQRAASPEPHSSDTTPKRRQARSCGTAAPPPRGPPCQPAAPTAAGEPHRTRHTRPTLVTLTAHGHMLAAGITQHPCQITVEKYVRTWAANNPPPFHRTAPGDPLSPRKSRRSARRRKDSLRGPHGAPRHRSGGGYAASIHAGSLMFGFRL